LNLGEGAESRYFLTHAVSLVVVVVVVEQEKKNSNKQSFAKKVVLVSIKEMSKNECHFIKSKN
jgi:hypothetical protein